MARRPLPLPAPSLSPQKSPRRNSNRHLLGILHKTRSPAATLTDNGVVYTTRFGGGGRSSPNAYETLGIEQCNSRPGHPTTEGKIERLWQTLKRWITAQPKVTGIAELNEQLARFMRIYNEERPHSALNGKTPHYIYTTQPKLGSVALSESESDLELTR